MMMLPEIVVGDDAAGSVLRTAIPAPMLPTIALASGVVPIALHVIVVPDAGADSEMPSPSNRRKMKPLITVPVPPETVRPDVAIPAPDPSSRTSSVGGPGVTRDGARLRRRVERHLLGDRRQR